MGLFDHFPYTNFHSLNIEWAIEKIQELLQQGETLYAQLEEWKEDTDTELATWKTQTLADLDTWKNQLTADLEAWKQGVDIDFASYEQQLSAMVEQAEQYKTAAEESAAQAASSAAALTDVRQDYPVNLETDAVLVNRVISSNGIIVIGTGRNNYSLQLPRNPEWTAIRVTAQQEMTSFVSLVTSSIATAASQSEAPLCPGTSRHRVDFGATDTLELPDSCAYIVFHSKTTDTPEHYYDPASVVAVNSNSMEGQLYAAIDEVAQDANSANSKADSLFAMAGAERTTLPCTWVQGGIWGDDGTHVPGSDAASTRRVRTNYIKTTSRMFAALCGMSTDYEYWAVQYDSNMAYSREIFSWSTGPKQFAVEPGYIRLSARLKDDITTDLTPEAFLEDSGVTLEYYPVLTSIYAQNTAPYINFNVSISLAWPNINLTTDTNAEEDLNPVTRQCILTLPDSYDPDGKPVPLVMLSHGASGHISGSTWYSTSASDQIKAIAAAYKEAGFAVFDVDNTRGSADGWKDWGSLPLMSTYIKAWDYIKANYNVESRLFIHAFSMGTVAALNMAKWYPGQIAAMVHCAARTGVVSRYTSYSADDQAEMAASFELNNGDWTEERLQGFLNYEKIVTIGSTDYLMQQMPPIKVLLGGNDTDASAGYPAATEAVAYYTALANSGTYVSLRTVAGKTHTDMCYLPSTYLRQECVDWMVRFL